MSHASDSDLATQLIQEWEASPARDLFDRLDTFEQSIEIFSRNCDAIENAIRGNAVENIDDFETFLTNFRTNRVEILRHLHNFVAAAHSLVDHTRVMYRELYAPDDLISDYPKQIEDRFVNDPVVAFIKCFRQFCQHYRVPFVTTNIDVVADGDEAAISTTLALNRDDLYAFSGWNSAANEFLTNASDDIPLLDVVEAYRNKVADFCAWFREAQRNAHREEHELRDRFVRESQRRSNGKAQFVQ